MTATTTIARDVRGRLYERLGQLLRYPGPDVAAALAAAREEVALAPPEVAAPLGAFLAAVAGRPGSELEELYTRTFDLNPICALEVGWHLYGEAYERGAFLVKARGLLADLGVGETAELPDHLTALLPALARLAPEEAAAFVRSYLLPALDKMLAGLAGKENPYEPLLGAVRALAAEDLR
jgi:nitrate reductase delta subunit